MYFVFIIIILMTLMRLECIYPARYPVETRNWDQIIICRLIITYTKKKKDAIVSKYIFFLISILLFVYKQICQHNTHAHQRFLLIQFIERCCLPHNMKEAWKSGNFYTLLRIWKIFMQSIVVIDLELLSFRAGAQNT